MILKEEAENFDAIKKFVKPPDGVKWEEDWI